MPGDEGPQVSHLCFLIHTGDEIHFVQPAEAHSFKDSGDVHSLPTLTPAAHRAVEMLLPGPKPLTPAEDLPRSLESRCNWHSSEVHGSRDSAHRIARRVGNRPYPVGSRLR